MPWPTRPTIAHAPVRHVHLTRPFSILMTALLVTGLMGVAPANGYAGRRVATPAATVRPQAFRAMPLSFEPNRGQAAPGTAFLARGHRYSVALHAAGVLLTLSASASSGHQATAIMTLVGANRAAVGGFVRCLRRCVGARFGASTA